MIVLFQFSAELIEVHDDQRPKRSLNSSSYSAVNWYSNIAARRMSLPCLFTVLETGLGPSDIRFTHSSSAIERLIRGQFCTNLGSSSFPAGDVPTIRHSDFAVE